MSHGGAVRIFNLCRALSDRVDFGLIAIRESGEAIVYDKLHEVFRDVGIVDLDKPQSQSAPRQDLPHQVRRYESASLRALVADICQNWKPDLVQIEYTHLAGLRDNEQGIPAILVEHDLTFGLYRQLAEHEQSAASEHEYARWLDFEQKWLHAYDSVWTVSDEEREQAMRFGPRPGDRERWEGHGTPQGGVVSPLLANLYMNRFLKYWRITGRGEMFRAQVINYADDFAILSRGYAMEALNWTRSVMTRIGLTLNEAKTGIKQARTQQFDFLGYTFGPQRLRKNGLEYLGASPSKKSVPRLRQKVGDLLGRYNMAPWSDVRDQLNRILRGCMRPSA
jgi:hypothetical protein